jgi:hypothetical protein
LTARTPHPLAVDSCTPVLRRFDAAAVKRLSRAAHLRLASAHRCINWPRHHRVIVSWSGAGGEKSATMAREKRSARAESAAWARRGHGAHPASIRRLYVCMRAVCARVGCQRQAYGAVDDTHGLSVCRALSSTWDATAGAHVDTMYLFKWSDHRIGTRLRCRWFCVVWLVRGPTCRSVGIQ